MGRSLTLAGDIGGTKAYLGIFRSDGEGICCLEEGRFPTARYSGVSELLLSFIETSGHRPERVVVGVPGPVRHPPVRPVNLPWTIDPVEIGERLGIADVRLLNDLEATAYGTLVLPPDDLVELNRGIPDDEGNIAVIAAGTGLGEGGLCWTGERFVAIPSEGGHASFAPGTGLESELWTYLFSRFGHVSWERVVSGPGLVHIYDFFKSTGRGQEPAWLGRELASGQDRPGVISRAAIRGDELASLALELFVSLYGAEAGNLALKLMSTGGVFVGGGIAPKIADKLRLGSFMKGFTEKGRVADILEALPVHIILNDKTGLLGAAYFGVHLGFQEKEKQT
jgi:glucokinase